MTTTQLEEGFVAKPQPADVAAVLHEALRAANYLTSPVMGEGDGTHIVVPPSGVHNEDEPSVWIKVTHGA